MNNAIETNPSPVTLATDSANIQLPQPVADAGVKTHHELTDTDKLAKDIQEAGVPEAKAEGASVAPSTEASPDTVRSIETEIKRAEGKNHKAEESAGWKRVEDILRLGRKKIEGGFKQPKAA